MSTLLSIAKVAKANLLTQLIITEPIRNTNNFNKKNFVKKYIVDEVLIEGHQVITLTKKKEFNSHVIYLHGGSYTDEALILHRIFIERILTKYDIKVTFIDYPLTPEYEYKEIQRITLKAIKDLMKRYKNDTFYFIGDSAGGGLTVRMLQELNKRKLLITKSVLLSPWIDVSMSNKDIKKQLNSDFTLNLPSLIECGLRYAGNYSTKGKLVSPIYGDLNNLGSLLIYASDNELLYPDISKFDALVNKSKNSSSKLIIGNNLCHDYPLLIIKETKNIIPEITNFLLEK